MDCVLVSDNAFILDRVQLLADAVIGYLNDLLAGVKGEAVPTGAGNVGSEDGEVRGLKKCGVFWL